MSLSPQDKDLLENVDWHIIPVLNPDGMVDVDAYV
jgi:murein tripeptide amidase MpaA